MGYETGGTITTATGIDWKKETVLVSVNTVGEKNPYPGV